ncbi:MAG: Fic family protein [Pseudomonadota bacterium]
MRDLEETYTRLGRKQAELERLRPLHADSLAALDRWYDVELTYTSNAIEGNTLTRSETAIVIEKGITVRGKRLHDHLEAIDHDEAVRLMRDLASGSAPVDEAAVLDLHRVVLKRSLPDEAGRYSQFQRRIAGSVVVFPSPHKVPDLMKTLGAWLAASEPSPKTAFEAHFRLVAIHPFSDGNGRTARLLMNLILLRAGYPIVAVLPEDRADYIDAIEARHLGRDGAPLEVLLAVALERSLDQYLATVQV